MSDFSVEHTDLQSFVMFHDSPDLSVSSQYIMLWAHVMHSVVRLAGKTTGSCRISHILIVCLCMTTLTEVFPCFFLSCNANARVKPAKTGHGPHSS